MASLSFDKAKGRWRIQFLAPDGSRRSVSMKATRARDKGQSKAAAFKNHIEELSTAIKSGTTLSPQVDTWVHKLPMKTHAQLVDGLRTANKTNRKRQHFVTPQETGSILSSCSNAEWRALIALARYGGLRVPSESASIHDYLTNAWPTGFSVATGIELLRDEFGVPSQNRVGCDDGRQFQQSFAANSVSRHRQ